MPSKEPLDEIVMLTIKEVAKALKLSVSQVYSLVARGEIASFAFGRAKRVRLSDFEDYVERSRVIDTRLPPGYRRHF